ncbi:unnamed protein product [Schistocephalus solidus]|uniref:RES domain-containing protein n=1 Tax=Schistocephalus solidus TaxID=70667 RepID=A0A183T1U8_SCHSO|nr:unnamed protein product [Schistocephalus solidus]
MAWMLRIPVRSRTSVSGILSYVDAEDSGPLQDFRVRDPVLPSHLQFFAEAAEMEVIQLPGLVNTAAIPHGGLQLAEGLTGFGDPLGNLVIDSRFA